jgi:hypothetical protein
MRVGADKARAVVLCPGCKRQVRAPAATVLEGVPLPPADAPPVAQNPPPPGEGRPPGTQDSPAEAPAGTPAAKDEPLPRPAINPALIAVGIAGVLAFTMVVLVIGFSISGGGSTGNEPRPAEDHGTVQPEAKQGKPAARPEEEGWSGNAQVVAGAVCGALCLAVIVVGIAAVAHWAQTPCPGCGRRWTLIWADPPPDGSPAVPSRDNQRVCRACGWRGA